MAIQLPYTDGFITPAGGSNNFESKDNKGQVNGYAPLDANAKVPTANLPDQASLDAEVDGKIAKFIKARDDVLGDQAYGPNTDKIVTFNQSVPNGIDSEIGYWGFGVENANGKVAYIEPEGLHVGYASTSVSIESDKVQLDNGAKLRKGTTDAQLGGNKGIALECSAQYELKWEAGRLYTMQQNGTTIRSVEHCMSAPSSVDDETKGYVIGTRWVMDSGKTYVCTHSSEANADWELKFSQENGQGTAGYINTSGDASGNAGGYIDTSATNGYAGGGYINTTGADGTGGFIDTRGNNVGHSGGSINTSAGDEGSGGSINTSGGNLGHGGSISTSNGGGSIDTSSKGGSINTAGDGSRSGGSINLSAGENGAGGSINGSDKGGSVLFYGTYGRQGGSIDISAGNPTGGTIYAGKGGLGGSITLKGGNGLEESNSGDGGTGGTIIGIGGMPIVTGYTPTYNEAILATGHNAGTINFSGGNNGAGGNIDISNGGGSINTRGVGSIQLGQAGTRTTLNGSASNTDKTITLPNATGTIALTNDSRFTDTRTPTSHTHGNITNDGKIGSTANLPLITTTSGVVTTGTFGTTANSFCQGNDTRLNNRTVFVLGGEEKANFATGTYYYGCQLTRASRPPHDGNNQINLGFKVVGNWTIKDVLIHQTHSTQYTGSLTYSIVTLSTSSNLITSIINAGSAGGSGNYGICGTTVNVNISDGEVLALCMTANASVGQTLPTNIGVTTVTAHLYCVPR